MDGVGVGVEELTDDGVGVDVGVKLGEELSDRTVEVEMLEKTMVVLEEMTKVELKTELEAGLGVEIGVGVALELNPEDEAGETVADDEEADELRAVNDEAGREAELDDDETRLHVPKPD